MKKLNFLAAVCCMLAVFTAMSITFVSCKKDKTDEPKDPTIEQNGGNQNEDETPDPANGHGYVDLGLSVKWATCNVGATAPEGYGDYFAWGETEPKTTYNWSTYKWYNESESTLTKYIGVIDNKTVLELTDDAARANWGGAWRMPTDAEWAELRDNCAWAWTDNYNGTGVAGRIVTSSTNGNSIFLPVAGCRGKDALVDAGDYGYYWSSSLNLDDPDYAWNVYFYSGSVYGSYSYRYFGRSVRPVLGE